MKIWMCKEIKIILKIHRKRFNNGMLHKFQKNKQPNERFFEILQHNIRIDWLLNENPYLSQLPSFNWSQLIGVSFEPGAHIHWKQPRESRKRPFSHRSGQCSTDGHTAAFTMIVGSINKFYQYYLFICKFLFKRLN